VLVERRSWIRVRAAVKYMKSRSISAWGFGGMMEEDRVVWRFVKRENGRDSKRRGRDLMRSSETGLVS
jgi:hypothetical protein